MITIGEFTGIRRPKRYCDGKHQHASQGAAEAHIRALKRMPNVKNPELLRAYCCTNCGKWHTGRIRPEQSASA